MKRRSVPIWPLILLAFVGAQSGPATAQPLRLGMEPLSHSVTVGSDMTVRCVLLDANNKPAKAPKDMTVNIETIDSTLHVRTIPVVVKAGEDSYLLKVPATETGITQLRARQSEMQGGSTFIKIKPQGTLRNLILTNAPAAAPPHAATTLPSRPVAAIILGSASVNNGAAATVASSVAHDTSSKRGLILKHEDRTFYADGKDEAVITAFLDGDDDGAPANVLINLSDNLGKMLPFPLTIPSGQEFAETKITSEHPGIATVEFISSTPKIPLHSEKAIQIRFGPPIAQLGIQASPRAFSLLEKADVSIQLLNTDGKPIPTDEPRRIELSFTGGGQLQTNTLVIPTNVSTAHTTFYPIHLGRVVISASSDNLLTQNITLSITRPTTLLFSSLLGGTLGGLLAASASQKRRRDKSGLVIRTLLGTVTGFTLYYYAVLGFISPIPGAIALNPFAAIFLSILGGWLGTEVFTPICKRLLPK